MKNNILSVILMLFVISTHANAGNVNFFLGQKALDENEWAPVDEQGEFGVLVDFKQANWPVSMAIDFLVSVDEKTDAGFNVEGITTEIDFGVRKIWEIAGNPTRPYIGGGLALISGEFTVTGFSSVTDDDSGLGIWLNAGIYWTLGQSFNIGLDLRYSQADVTLFGLDVDAGGTHAGLILGYHWQQNILTYAAQGGSCKSNSTSLNSHLLYLICNFSG